MLHLDDTIAAIATPPGPGGVGIVRVAGPGALGVAGRLFDARRPGPAGRAPAPGTFRYGWVRDPESGERVDDALLLVFRAPHSYTGDDVAELQCHGGPVTLGRVLSLALRAGARMAEPGEFTRRAFLNGRMDLAQAEAVCDQIVAKTEAARRLALAQRQGGLSRAIGRLRDSLLGALAAVEVTLDFSDEVGDLDYPAMERRLAAARLEVERLLETAGRGRLYREGVRLVIVGRPNVGKSSLLNALLREDRAIVTPVAGTTRDVIEEAASVRGIPVVAIDTAGLRETTDLVERIGVERAHAALEQASVALLVIDAADGWTEEDAEIARRIAGRPAVWVLNKVDLLPAAEAEARLAALRARAADAPVVAASALAGEGIDALEAAIAALALGEQPARAAAVVVSSARHQQALETARDSLVEAERTTAERLPPDFISIDIRAAVDALGQITGETASDELIHRIFQDFCVGK